MTEAESLLGASVYHAIQQASNGSERSQQQQEFTIGVSDVGVCPERVRRMLAGIPEPITDKLSAFIGTAVGDHVEQAYAVANTEAIIQTVVQVAMSGDQNDYLLTGHPDIVMPWGVIDVKGLALDTPIPTPYGWTVMGDIQKGDLVYDMDGQPVRVRSVSGIKNIDCYRVTFRNGHQVVCDGNHIWWADVHSNGLREWSISDLFDKQHQGIRVPVTAPLVGHDLPLQLDPWFLGYWLGNGATASGNNLSCHQRDRMELESLVRAAGFEVWSDLDTRSENGATLHVSTIGGRQRDERGCWISAGPSKALADIGVLGDKHIPAEYLRASQEQRLALLRGLMDSDGTWNKRRNRVVFAVTNARLAHQVAELARSLGQRVSISPVLHLGFGLEVTAWHVEWTPTINPFSLNRKAELVDAAPAKQSDFSSHHRVTKIEKIESVSTRCIAVDSPTRSFLCGEAMIPTHNTVDGLEATRRTGPTFGQLFQRHAYTKGAFDSGLLSVSLEEARTANVWIDRSGRTKEPFVHMDTYNEHIVQDGAFWLDEVYYAFEHDVAAEKTPPREWCKVACGHFEDCRLYDSDVTGLLTDEKVLAAIDMYQEGKALKKEGARLQDEAKPILVGIDGYTHEYQLRWTAVNETEVPSFTRSGYDKLVISKRRS